MMSLRFIYHEQDKLWLIQFLKFLTTVSYLVATATLVLYFIQPESRQMAVAIYTYSYAVVLTWALWQLCQGRVERASFTVAAGAMAMAIFLSIMLPHLVYGLILLPMATVIFLLPYLEVPALRVVTVLSFSVTVMLSLLARYASAAPSNPRVSLILEVLTPTIIIGLIFWALFRYHTRLTDLLHNAEQGNVALQEAQQLLEQRVAARTADLGQANSDLQRERNFAATVLDTVETLVTVLNQEGNIVRFNRACEQTLGYKEEDVRGRYVWELFGFEPLQAKLQNHMQQVIESREPSDMLEAWVTSSGEARLIRSTSALLGDAGGTLYLVITGQDITAIMAAEEQRRFNEALTYSVLESSPAQIAVLNGTGHILLTNTAWDTFVEELGNKGIPISRSSPFPAILMDSEEAQDAERGIHHVLEQRAPLFSLEYPCTVCTLARWFLMQVAPRTLPDGGAVVTHTDITERKLAEQALLRSERLAALGKLSAALAHEINNPLQAMRSNLDLVLDFPTPAEEQREMLEIVRHEVVRLSEGTAHMLNFARPRPRPSEPTQPVTVIRQTLALARKELMQRRILVETHFDTVQPVWMTEEELSQVSLNLILNARDAIPNAGQLTIEVHQEAQEAVITFTNSGKPIPPQTLAHIFEPFFTTKGDGTGLGLSICQALVERHDGTITVTNLPHQQGVKFAIRLPTVREKYTGRGLVSSQ